uniref:Uncharacterized protein n=1 Tax=Fagus sylvatica TaxID=28930 RepID=A0A2N9HK65_FAGSY
MMFCFLKLSTVKSFYCCLSPSLSMSFPWKGIWKPKVPPRVTFFLWTAALGKVLTADNLRKRNIVIISWCCMCKKDGESIDHLFLHCEIAKELWNLILTLFGVHWVMPRSVRELVVCWHTGLGRHRLNGIWKAVPHCLMCDNLDSNRVLENSLSAKEKIISELNLELHNIETTLSNEREEHLNEIKKLNVLLNEKEVTIEGMKKELQARPTQKTVDDLRKKMKIFQAVDYNSIEAEDWEVATSGEEMSKMESLLLNKNRKMEHELTQLKVKFSEKTSLLDTAEAKIVELTAKVNEQKMLIQKLEDDILKGYSSKDRKGNLFDEWDLSEAGGSELSENTDQKHVSSDQDQSSMLKVICNQRDRFRARLRETEEEIRHLKEKIGLLTAELEKTKADNVKLYGKIRYVQDYNHERVVSRGSKKQAEDLESGFASDVESKYKKIYEDDINPFAAFSKKVVILELL